MPGPKKIALYMVFTHLVQPFINMGCAHQIQSCDQGVDTHLMEGG